MAADSLSAFLDRVNVAFVLDHAGRAGNGFFMTLFDQHPEVLSCPWMHYNYSYIVSEFGDADELDTEKVRDFLNDTYHYFHLLSKDLDDARAAFIREIGGDPDAPVRRSLVRETVDRHLDGRSRITRRELIALIYLAYARGLGRDLARIRYLLLSDSISLRDENVFDGFSGRVLDCVTSDFPGAKLIHLVRDPRAGFASSNHQFVNSLGNMYGIHWGNYWKRFARLLRLDFDWDSVFVFGFWLIYFRQTFVAAERKKAEHARLFTTVKNEDLNLNFRRTMEGLCAWLGVRFLPAWSAQPFTPTMVGRPWAGTGAYNDNYQRHHYGPLENDPPEVSRTVTGPNAYVTRRWKERLARHEILILERLLRPELEAYGYPVLEDTPGRGGARFLIAMLKPLRGELPAWKWIARGRHLGPAEVADRLFYALSFQPFYIAGRLALLYVIRCRNLFPP